MFHLMPWATSRRTSSRNTTRHGCGSQTRTTTRSRHELYNRYLVELELAEPLGFVGVCVNEHHQNAYGLMPSPNLFAATLARRTKNIKIAVVGNAPSDPVTQCFAKNSSIAALTSDGFSPKAPWAASEIVTSPALGSSELSSRA